MALRKFRRSRDQCNARYYESNPFVPSWLGKFSSLVLLSLTACGTIQSLQGPTPTIVPWYPSTNEAGDTIFAVYSNRIPCAECDLEPGPASKIKVELVLYGDPATGEPTTYALARVYPGADGPEDRMETFGTWTITQGAGSDPDDPVYLLDANSPQQFRRYLVLSEDILFILDDDGYPLPGDGFYSYTLNRTR